MNNIEIPHREELRKNNIRKSFKNEWEKDVVTHSIFFLKNHNIHSFRKQQICKSREGVVHIDLPWSMTETDMDDCCVA